MSENESKKVVFDSEKDFQEAVMKAIKAHQAVKKSNVPLSQRRDESVTGDDWISMNEAIALSGIGNSYLRTRLLPDGAIVSKKVFMPGTLIKKIYVSRSSLEAYMKTHKRVSGDKVRILLSPDEVSALLSSREAKVKKSK